MASANIRKGSLHLDDLVSIRLQLVDCVILPIQRTNSNLMPGACLELAGNLADIVIVNGLGSFHVRNRTHVN